MKFGSPKSVESSDAVEETAPTSDQIVESDSDETVVVNRPINSKTNTHIGPI